MVIIGAGHAGVQAAASLRQQGYEAAVTIVSDEQRLPYHRPPLSKELLSGGDPLALRPESFYADQQVTLLRGTRAQAIDRGAAAVVLHDGTRLPYDQLILATGSRPRRLALPGVELSGVQLLRVLDDGLALREQLRSGSRLTVIGGGFIGLEVAAAAVSAGLEVTVVEALTRVLARVCSRPTAAHIEAVHRAWGVDLRLGAGVARLLGDSAGRVCAVELSSGERIDSDTVLIGVGAQANAELAAAAGLELDGGVVVDATLRTADPRIWAIGDCASFPLGAAATRRRLESVQNATDHARSVAASIVAEPQPYTALPWFWSYQNDCRLQIAGLIDGHDRTELIGDPSAGSFSVHCYAGQTLLGVESVNAPREHVAARRLLSGEGA